MSDGQLRAQRGQKVEFKLGNGADKHTVAYFQFPDRLFELNHKDLEYATLEYGSTLDPLIHSKARENCHGNSRHGPSHVYAIFILPEKKWVHGSNPPPSVDVGGG